MGHIVKTPAGAYRANWRDPAGRQRAKTFKTRKDAKGFLAEVESTKNRGSYVDPAAGKTLFREHAGRWWDGRSIEDTTSAASESRLRARILPQWGAWKLSSIDHMAVQQWATDLGKDLAPSTVASVFADFSSIMSAAVRAKLIAQSPCEGIRLPSQRKSADSDRIITEPELTERLLPAMPARYRVVAALAAGAGLRWGECLGLRWGSVDLAAGSLVVSRVVVEVAGRVSSRPYPKSSAGRRLVPLAPFLASELKSVLAGRVVDPAEPVLVGPDGGSLRRSNFRRRVWIPSLLRAGLIAGMQVESMPGDGGYRLWWVDRAGERRYRMFRGIKAMFEYAANVTPDNALHFHDLRHCYATWLVSRGVPINVVQKVLGHEQASTTLNRYTHTPGDFLDQVRDAFTEGAADFSLTFPAADTPVNDEDPSEEGS